MIEVNKKILKEVYKTRDLKKYFRKYDFGSSFILGGSDFYSSSPALSAMAALKSGLDRVRVIAPQRAANIIASFSPEFNAFPLKGKKFKKEHLSILLSMIKARKSVARNNFSLVIGKGLGRNQESQDLILDLISKVSTSLVIDADGIYALAENTKVLDQERVIITPHSYEFFVLTGEKVFEMEQNEKIEAVKKAAKKMKIVIVLKGQPDIISNGKEVALNKEGSPYMSVGGTGDVLAGICGALLARSEIDPFTAAQAATYLSGKAGELAAQNLKAGLTPLEVIKNIPKVYE